MVAEGKSVQRYKFFSPYTAAGLSGHYKMMQKNLEK